MTTRLLFSKMHAETAVFDRLEFPPLDCVSSVSNLGVEEKVVM